MEYLVGTGGWGYFNAGGKSSLKAYSDFFNFVEVNYTFYEYPEARTVERWRHSVPANFVFSVRCHQDLTHRIGFKTVDQAYEVFYQMRSYCDLLKTPYLVLETPASYIFGDQDVDLAQDFFSSLNLEGLELVWEYRGLPSIRVVELMADFNIIQCVDLSCHVPILKQDTVYSRLFGKGQHNLYQFSDDELLEIQVNANDTNARKVILSFHGPRMHSDALRFRMHRTTGKFLPVTDYVGVDSAKTVLAEDASFPATKTELINRQGWKVIDLKPDRRVHLGEVLEMIPDKTYSNLEEVVTELRAVM
jgi:uncharacterized protein YecE (DUF72 family)